MTLSQASESDAPVHAPPAAHFQLDPDAARPADGSRASHQAVAELKAEGVLPAQTLVRTNKYLNNMIEQDHRKVKQRCYPMLGFKTFGNVDVTLSGIELANKIKKGKFDTSEITGPGAIILQVWELVLIA